MRDSVPSASYSSVCNVQYYVNGTSRSSLLIESTDSMIYIYVMHKVRIRTILGFCCANLGSELLCNNPRIAHVNLESARNLLGSRSQTSAICGNKPPIDRARKAARPSAATNPRCRGWPSCFECAIDRGFVAADGRGLAARS